MIWGDHVNSCIKLGGVIWPLQQVQGRPPIALSTQIKTTPCKSPIHVAEHVLGLRWTLVSLSLWNQFVARADWPERTYIHFHITVSYLSPEVHIHFECSKGLNDIGMVVLGYQVHSSLTMLHVAREINILSKLHGCIISPHNGQLAFVRSSQHQ